MAFADKAIEFDDNTQTLIYQQMRLMCQAHVQPDNAVAGGEQLIQIHSNNPGVLYHVACVCSIASGKTVLPQQDQFAARAMELLKQCHSRNLFSSSQGKQKLDAPELAPLRQRADFKQLIIEANDYDAETSANALWNDAHQLWATRKPIPDPILAFGQPIRLSVGKQVFDN